MNIYNLIYFRCMRKMTKAELSQCCDMEKVWRKGDGSGIVHDIETFRAVPTLERMLNFAKALHISPVWLVHSPLILRPEDVIELLKKIYTFTGGFNLVKSGPDEYAIALKEPYNSILFDIKEHRKTDEYNSTKYNEWRYKCSVYERPSWACDYEPTNTEKGCKQAADVARNYTRRIVLNNLLVYFNKHNISDFKIGKAMGYNGLQAGVYGTAITQGLQEPSTKELTSIIESFELNYLYFLDDFSIENMEHFNHAILALEASKAGVFMVGEQGEIGFVDANIRREIGKVFGKGTGGK